MNNTSESDITIKRILELKGNDSQEVFANKIHMSQANMSKMLNGMPPSASTLIAIATEYDVSVDWLLGLSDRKSIVNIPSAENMTYADALAVLDKLLEEKSIEDNGRNNHCIMYINDKVLIYLMESRYKVSTLDEKLRRFWYKSIAERFADSKVIKWDNMYDQYFDQYVPDNPNEEDILKFIDYIYMLESNLADKDNN